MSKTFRQHATRARRLGAGLLALSTATGIALAGPGTAAASPRPAPSKAASTSCAQLIPFHAENFPDPLRIDNRFLPMSPGTQLTLRGTVGGTAHTVVFTVTDLTKVIDGVHTRVIYDVDSDGKQVQEAELAFFAQDDLGNVWNLGEYPEVYENGVFTGAPDTWISGLSGAKAGLHMLAAPVVGGPEYRQGYAPRIDFLDCASVVATGGRVCVPVACYGDVLTTQERSPLDPESGIQVKEHAPGVGIVRVSAIGDPAAETLVLVKLVHLNARGLADVRTQALQLDARGYDVSNVYARTALAVGPGCRPNPQQGGRFYACPAPRHRCPSCGA
jgi:hypothetical protein